MKFDKEKTDSMIKKLVEGGLPAEECAQFLRLLETGDASDEVRFNAVAVILDILLPRQGCNKLRSLGLYWPEEADRGFHGAIKRYVSDSASHHEYPIRLPQTGEIWVGNGPPPKNHSRKTLLDKVLHTKISTLDEPIDDLDLQGLLQWWADFEYEDHLTRMAGLRGNDNYIVFEEPQKDIKNDDPARDLSIASEFPKELQQLHEINPITKPTRLLNGWSPPETKSDMDHNFENATKWTGGEPIEWLKALYRWLRDSSDARDGYRMRPARLNLSPEESGPLSNHFGPKCYVMLVSHEIAEQIRMDPNIGAHKGRFVRAANQSFMDQFICKVENILIAVGDRMPRFKAGSKQFCRALVFGERSLVCGYSLEGKYKKSEAGELSVPTVFDCWNCNDSLGCRTSYGSKAVCVPRPGHEANVDCGRVAIDLQED